MNIKDLRNELVDSFNDLKGGTLKKGDAKEITNMAGKIISSAKVEMDYNKLVQNARKVDFLEVDSDTGDTGDIDDTDTED